MLALDYAKAFDSISKPFLLLVFSVFGFGPDFHKWVSVLTKGSVCCTNHGGWLSEPFEVMCGIRQGCPFSPLAFVLAVEILAIKIALILILILVGTRSLATVLFLLFIANNSTANTNVIQNDLWKDILETHIDNKNTVLLDEVTQNNVHIQMLFNNSLVTYRGKVLFFRKWVESGLEQIKDTLHANENRLLTLEEVQGLIENNGGHTVFEYNALVNALPRAWAEWIELGTQRENDQVIEQTQMCEAILYIAKAKEIKKILTYKNKTIAVRPHACDFWR